MKKGNRPFFSILIIFIYGLVTPSCLSLSQIKCVVSVKQPLFIDSYILSQDKTFTCTLFAPSTELDRLCSADVILSWFKFYFPDAVRAIGEQRLVEDFMKNPRCPLICTKVKKIKIASRCIEMR